MIMPRNFPPGTSMALRGVCYRCHRDDRPLVWVQLANGAASVAICINRNNCGQAIRRKNKKIDDELPSPTVDDELPFG